MNVIHSSKQMDILPLGTTWTNLEGIMLKRITQNKDKYCIISLKRGPSKVTLISAEYSCDCQKLAVREMGGVGQDIQDSVMQEQ